MSYDRKTISNAIEVPTDSKVKHQEYQWFFYPQAGEYESKAVQYIRWGDKPLKRKDDLFKRATFFMNPLDLKKYIFESTWAYLKLIESKKSPQKHMLPEIRKRWLNLLLDYIKEKSMEKWGEGK